MISNQQEPEMTKEPIRAIAEKNHNRIEPKKDETYHLYSFSAYDDNQQNPVETPGEEINSAKYLVPSQSVLISKLNPRINRVWKVEDAKKNAICSTEFIVLQPRENIPLDYLYAILNEPSFRSHLTQLTTGTSGSHQRVKQTDILDYELSKFDEAEQNIIANIYGSLDNKIGINNRINGILEEMAQTLFKSEFVRYESYENFKNTKLGKIPENFEIVEFSDICTTEGGGTPSTEEDTYWGGDILWLTPKEIASLRSSVAFDTERKLTEKGLKNSSAKIMPKHSTLLYSRGANMGVSVINKEPMATNQGFVCIEPKGIPPHFMFHLVLANRSKIENIAGGSTYPEISQTSFNELEVAIPSSMDAVDKFENKVEIIYEDIHKRVVENENLEELRDTLLPKLMSGEIRLDDINLNDLKVDSEV